MPDHVLATVLINIFSICSHKSLDFVIAKPKDILTSVVFQDIRTQLVERGMVRKTQEHICGLMAFRFGNISMEIKEKIKLINNLTVLEYIVTRLLNSASQEEINDSIRSRPALGFTMRPPPSRPASALTVGSARPG